MNSSSGLEKQLIQCLESLTGLTPGEQSQFNRVVAVIKEHHIDHSAQSKANIVTLLAILYDQFPKIVNKDNLAIIAKFSDALDQLEDEPNFKPRHSNR